MSGLIHSEARGDFAQANDKSLVANAAFHNEFYKYTTSINSSFATVGTFTLVPGATATTCPAGRIVHLNGRKLYPGVNPMNTFVGLLAVAGNPKFLVGVYDPITNLSGFVDPTSLSFSKYEQNLPNFFDRGPTANTAYYGSAGPPLGGQGGRLTVTEGGERAAAGVVITGSNSATVSTLQFNSTTSQVMLTAQGSGVTQLYYSGVVTGPAGFTGNTFTITTVGTAVAAINWLIIN